MRLFVAVWPDEAALAAVRAVPRPALEHVRWTRPEQWHVTLRFLGSTPDAAVSEIEDVLGGVATGSDARLATLGPASTAFGRSTLVLPVSGLDDLAASTVAATSRFGQAPDPRPFAGHLTLARARRSGSIRPLAGVPVSAAWPVREITLVRSVTRSDGALYDVIARFPLA